MKRALELSLAISLALTASHAFAVGLGQIQVKSRLNQPLVAEIPVTVDRGSDADSLAVSLASAEEFSRIGIDRSQIGVPLEFALVKNAAGQTVIRVTTEEPVRAPFLDFLLAANWNNGRVLREYTVLLDPPTTAPAIVATPMPTTQAAAPVVATPPPPPPPAPEPEVAKAPPVPIAQPEPSSATPLEAERPAAVRAEPAPVVKQEPRAAPEPVAVAPASTEPAAAPVSKPVIAAPKPAVKPPSPVAATKPLPPSVAASNGTNYGPVAAGETLWEIAQATLPDDSVSTNQLMLALLKANPEAFSRNNINRLKRGAILRIPSAEDIRAVGSMREATAQVRTQIAEWRQQTANPVLLAGSAAGSVDRVAATKPAFDNVSSDRLALVPPEMGKDGLASIGQAGSSAGSASGNVSAAELARANEALASSTQEAGELRSRVKDLETITSKNERLISLKDSEIADLQRRLAAAQASSSSDAASTSTPQSSSGIESPAVPATTETTASSASPDIATTAETTPPASSSAPPNDDIWGSQQSTADAGSEALAVASDVAGNPESSAAPPAGEASTSELPAGEGAPEAMPDAAPVDAVPDAPTSAAAIIDPMDSAEPIAPTALDPGTSQPGMDEQPWYLDPRILGGVGIIVLLLGLLGFRARRKPVDVASRPSIADRFAAGGVTPVVQQPGHGVVLLDEESQLAEQIEANPDDLGARLELLSIYYADNRVDEFRAAALEMQPFVDDPREAEWVQVRAMGEDLFPNDPLFSSGGTYSDEMTSGADYAESDQYQPDVAETGSTSESDLRWSNDGDDEIAASDESAPTETVAAPVVAAVDNELRYAPSPRVETPPEVADALDIGDVPRRDSGEKPIGERPEDIGTIDFSLEDAPDLDVEPAHAASVVSAGGGSLKGRPLTEHLPETTKSDSSFDFDLPPLDFETEFGKPKDSTTVVSADDEIELDDDFLVGEDALGTKLDLAKAYADMGDPDGARGMLEEVISQGDASQKDQARKLLEELG